MSSHPDTGAYKYTYVCKSCGEFFENVRYHNVLFCDECKTKKPVIKTCADCGNEFIQDTKEKRSRCRPCHTIYKRNHDDRMKIGSINKVNPALFKRCEVCDKEYIWTKSAQGKCPICRGVYHTQRLHWNQNRMEI